MARNFSDILAEAHARIDGGVTAAQIEAATPLQLATAWGIEAEDRAEFADRVATFKRKLVLYAEKKEGVTMLQQIMAKLTAEERQWIKKQDATRLSEMINPVVREVPNG